MSRSVRLRYHGPTTCQLFSNAKTEGRPNRRLLWQHCQSVLPARNSEIAGYPWSNLALCRAEGNTIMPRHVAKVNSGHVLHLHVRGVSVAAFLSRTQSKPVWCVPNSTQHSRSSTSEAIAVCEQLQTFWIPLIAASRDNTGYIFQPMLIFRVRSVESLH